MSPSSNVFTVTRTPANTSGAPTLLLIHGFPQDWYEWRTVLGRLAETFTVVAVDLRGVGSSDAPVDGYDAVTMASDPSDRSTSAVRLRSSFTRSSGMSFNRARLE